MDAGMSYPNMLLALCTISPSSMGQHSCPRDESGPTYPLSPCSSASSSFNLVFSPAKDSHDEDGRVEKCGRPGKSCATKTQEAARIYPAQTGRDRRLDHAGAKPPTHATSFYQILFTTYKLRDKIRKNTTKQQALNIQFLSLG